MIQQKSELKDNSVKIDDPKPNLSLEVKEEFISNENKSYEEILSEMNELPKIEEKKEDKLISDILGLNSNENQNDKNIVEESNNFDERLQALLDSRKMPL